MENCSYRCRNVTAVVPNDCLWSCPSLPAMRCSLRRRSAPCLPPGTRFLVCTLMPADCSQVVQPYVLVPVVGGGGCVDGAPSEKLPCVRLRVQDPAVEHRSALSPPRSREHRRLWHSPTYCISHNFHRDAVAPNMKPRGSQRAAVFISSHAHGAVRGAPLSLEASWFIILIQGSVERAGGRLFCFPPPSSNFPPKCAWSWWAAAKTSPLCLLFNGALPGAEPRQSRAQITPSWNSTGRSTQLSVHRDHRSPRLQSTLTLHRVNDLQWKIRNRKSNAIESVIGHVTVDIWPSYSGNMHRESVFSK